MKVIVKSERCVGHGMCNLVAPNVFALSEEDGHAQVIVETVTPELEEQVDAAKRSCPEEAIEVIAD
jgi:ferredoxin